MGTFEKILLDYGGYILVAYEIFKAIEINNINLKSYKQQY